MDKRLSPLVLAETALLGQGLPSLTNRQISGLWPREMDILLAWLDKGRLQTGDGEAFLQRRQTESGWKRAGSRNLEEIVARKEDAFLTVSALLQLFAGSGNKIIVTAGLGGVRGQTVSRDLLLIKGYPILVVATAFKDVLDYHETLAYAHEHDIPLYGWETGVLDGFIFHLPMEYRLKKIGYRDFFSRNRPLTPGILFHPLPLTRRLPDPALLQLGRTAGERAEEAGEEFHPAANRELDRLTRGQSSRLQLQALIGNLHLAQHIARYIREHTTG